MITIFQTKTAEKDIPFGAAHTYIAAYASETNEQSVYPFSNQKGTKTLPFGAAHTYITYIKEYPPDIYLHFLLSPRILVGWNTSTLELSLNILMVFFFSQVERV